jgi:hypothetical protein
VVAAHSIGDLTILIYCGDPGTSSSNRGIASAKVGELPGDVGGAAPAIERKSIEGVAPHRQFRQAAQLQVHLSAL